MHEGSEDCALFIYFQLNSLQVTECAKNLQIKGPFQIEDQNLDDLDEIHLTHDLLENLCRWTEVVRQSHDNPELVLKVLLKSHEYSVARQWAVIYKAKPVLLQVT